MDTTDLCDVVAKKWARKRNGDKWLVQYYQSTPKMITAIQKCILSDIGSQVNCLARTQKLDYWLTVAMEHKSPQLAHWLHNKGALDDRDGSKRRAAAQKKQSVEDEREDDQKEQEDAAQQASIDAMVPERQEDTQDSQENSQKSVGCSCIIL